MWYAAHLIEYLKFEDGKQDSFEVYENIVLIDAPDNQAAFNAAEKLGKTYEHSTIVGPERRPARWTFAGVRSLTECQDSDPETLAQPPDFKPKHATEITYLALVVDSEEALQKLINGEEVVITREDDRPPAPGELSEIRTELVESKTAR